mgnify:CR=1
MANSKKHVYIHFGPYDSCGVVAHRTDRLEGMQSMDQFSFTLTLAKKSKYAIWQDLTEMTCVLAK